MSKWLNVVIAVCVLSCGLGLYCYFTTDVFHIEIPQIMLQKDATALEEGKEYQIDRVAVLEGHIFDIKLENGKRYLIHLVNVVGTPHEATSKVIDYLNQVLMDGQEPILVPRKWNTEGVYWEADIYINGNSLTSWLETKGLVYSR